MIIQYSQDNRYIIAFSKESENDTEYTELLQLFNEKPIAPEGYEYVMTADRTWELVEQDEPSDEATEADYINALRDLGVNTDEEENA